MKIICGPDFLNYDNIEPNLFDINALMEELNEHQLRPGETLSVDEIQRLVSNNFTDAKQGAN